MKLLLKTVEGNIRCIADSAIGRTSQPWFVPDFGSDWRWHRALAVKIGRLGKGISPEFISRYIDGITLLWVADADNCEALDFMDSTVVCGSWLSIPEIPEEMVKAVVEVSHYATMKTGDIVAIMLPDEPQKIEPNTRISLDFLNQEVMNFNIK